MKKNYIFFSNRFKKYSFYTIFCITLHWTCVAPAQDIFDEFIDFNAHYIKDIFKNNTVKEVKRVKWNKKHSQKFTNPPVKNDAYSNYNSDNKTKTDALKSEKTNNKPKNRTYEPDLAYGKIGRSNKSAIDQPEDNVFTFELNDLRLHPSQYEFILNYSVKGVLPISVSWGINSSFNTGGYLITKSEEWVEHKEKINPNYIKKGNNHLKFSAANLENGHEYEIKNVQLSLVKKDESESSTIIKQASYHQISNDLIYIKGYLDITDRIDQDLKLTFDGIKIDTENGQFEGFYKSNSTNGKSLKLYSNKKLVDVKSLKKSVLSFDVQKLVQREDFPKIHQLAASTDESFESKRVNTQLRIKPKNTSKYLYFSNLRPLDITTLNSGLRNINKDGSGYRIYNYSNKRQEFEIELNLDDSLQNSNASIGEVAQFYFDKNDKSWRPLKKDTLDVINQTIKTTISIESGDEVDFINGVIETPDHPESNAFTPTQISDLDPIKPTEKINLMSPPKASQTGEANISYPIELPPGRNGMMPSLNLGYNSDAGSGWVGYGWNLNLPSIEVNSSWGVPLFNQQKESEVYNLSGEMLIYEDDYLPHRHSDDPSGDYNTELIDREGSLKNFFTRRHSNRAKIQRIGDATTNYYWKVTDTNGGITWYGGTEDGLAENSVLRDDNNNIVQWKITKQIDTQKNYIEYSYDKDIYSENESNLDGGKYIYPYEIEYTKNEDSNVGNYKIEFLRENFVREDPRVVGNRGFKEIDIYLLDEIVITHQDNLIRKYKLNYNGAEDDYESGLGRFHKSLLHSLEQYDENDDLFYEHTFEYYDDLSENDGDIYSDDHTSEYSIQDFNQISGGIDDLYNASLINTNSGLDFRTGIRPSFGMQFFYYDNNESGFFTIGTDIDYSTSYSHGKISLTDIDGDGVSDILYKSSGGLGYYKGNMATNLQNQNILNFDNNLSNINGINHFHKSNTQVLPGLDNLSLYFKGFNASLNYNRAKTTTDVYFTDANSDGLVDIVADGKVHFNYIDENGEPSFTTDSGLTENLVLTSTDGIDENWTDPNEDEAEEEDDLIEQHLMNSGDFDAAYVWVAPADGDIAMEGRMMSYNNDFNLDTNAPFYLVGETQQNGLNNNQPFRFLFKSAIPSPESFFALNYSDQIPGGINSSTNSLHVKKGQKLFFRNIGGNTPNALGVQHLQIRYLDENLKELSEIFTPSIVQDGAPHIGDKFILDDKPTFIENPSELNGINWLEFTIEDPKDEIRFQIIQVYADGNGGAVENLIYNQSALPGTNTLISPPTILDLAGIDDEPSLFLFRADSDTEINYKEEINPVGDGYTLHNSNFHLIQNWRPVIHTNNDTHYPIPKHATFWRMTSMDNLNLVGDSSLNLISGNYTANPVDPQTTITDIDPNQEGEFLFVSEKEGAIIDKVEVSINNSMVSFTESNAVVFNDDPSQITEEDEIRFGFYARGKNNKDLLEKYLTEVGYTSSVVISNFESPFYNFQTGATEYYDTHKHLGAMLGNRGMFFYNENNAESEMPADNYGKLIDQDAVFNYDPLNNTAIFDEDYDDSDSEDDIINDIGIDIPSEAELDDFDAQDMEDFSNQLSGISSDFDMPAIEVLPGTPERAEVNGDFDKLTGWMGFQKISGLLLLSGEVTLDPTVPGGGAPGLSGLAEVGDDYDDEPVQAQDANDVTGMLAVDKISRAESFSTSAGYSPAPNLSYINSVQNYQATDFIDLNGDGYPDNYYPSAIFYTNMTGGHEDQTTNDLGNVSEFSDSDTYFKLTGSAPSNFINPPVQKLSTLIGLPSDALGVSVSADMNFNGETYNDTYFIDVNGDGLTDRIDTSGNNIRMSYNFGNSHSGMSNAYTQNQLTRNETNQNSSYTLSASVGGLLSDVIPGGDFNAGLTNSSSNLNETYVDLNGDGLVDIVNLSNANSMISINKGNSFSSNDYELTNKALSDNVVNTALSASLRVPFFQGWLVVFFFTPPPFLMLIPILFHKAGVTAFGDVNLSYSKTEKDFRDVNGDGFVDFIESNDSSIKVYYSQIGRTNKLKTVHNPIKGSFTLDYEPQEKTYGNPNTKWALTHVEVEDTNEFEHSGENIMRKDFEYHNGKYDRREREFLGYEEVWSLEYYYDQNGNPVNPQNPYRGNIKRYYNQNYHLNGVLKEEIVFSGAAAFGEDPSSIFSHITFDYNLYGFNQDNEIDLNDELDLDYDSGGTEGRSRTVALLDKKTSWYYEFQNDPLIQQQEYAYDVYGHVIEFYNAGDVNYNGDEYRTEVTYHFNSGLDDNNILSIPQKIEVFDENNTLVRSRETSEIDSETGNIGRFSSRIDNNAEAVYDLEYDIYGNLKKIEYPENLNNERVSYEYVYDDVEHTYIEEITDHFNYTSKFEYEFKHGNLLKEIDYADNEILYSYDEKGRLTDILAPYEADENEAFTVQYQYHITPPSDMDAEDFVPYAITTHNSHAINNSYIDTYTFIDGMNRVVQVKNDHILNSNSHVMKVSGWVQYDYFGRATLENHPHTEPKDSEINKLINTELPNDNYFKIINYDQIDRVKNTINPEGAITTFNYSISDDIDNRRLFMKRTSQPGNQGGNMVTQEYSDLMNNPIFVEQIADENMEVKYNYNSIGELESYRDAENIETTYEYDMLGRKLQVVNQANYGAIDYAYDNLGNITRKRTAVLAENNQLINYHYEFNRLTTIEYPEVEGEDNLANVHYQYGNSGNETGKVVTLADATGTTAYKYGKMGEVVETDRTIVAPNLPDRNFKTKYTYDSWNRILEMTYPDGENLFYNYNQAGNLKRIVGDNSYIVNIEYNKFNNKTLVELGNGVVEKYQYTPEMQRLAGKALIESSTGIHLLKKTYEYNTVGNVIEQENVASPYQNGSTPNTQMSGPYKFKYEYDNLNRLIKGNGDFQGENSQIDFGNNASSEFNLALEYTPTGGILNKNQKHIQDNNLNTENSYSNNYEYVENSHKVKRILNSENNLQIDFNYDANGNMTLATDNQNFANRHYWDEENRLRVVDQSNIMHHYIYDANGERVLKSSSDFIEVAENGTVIGTQVTFDNYTTYASPEIVVDGNNNYTKHYYNGSTRFLTRLGGNADLFAENAAEGRIPPSGTDDAGNPDKTSINFDPDKLRKLQISDLSYYFRKGEKKTTPSFKEFKDNSVESNQDNQIDEDLYKDLFEETNFTDPEPLNIAEAFYYYHADHLGSNELLTDFSGEPHEFHLTLPFGETMVEQRKIAANYYNSWKFTGKELDEETGFYYFGARYYQPKWSIWLSVDPLAEQAPDKTPYHYVSNNPINRIDPDGRKDVIYDHEGNQTGVENDNWWHNLIFGERSYITDENGEDRYRLGKQGLDVMKSEGFEGLMSDWETSSSEDGLHSRIKEATIGYDPMEESILSYVLRESDYGGDMDQKLNLNKNKLYVFAGKALNVNEAGNVVWGAAMNVFGMDPFGTYASAHGGTLIIANRLDERDESSAAIMGSFYMDRSPAARKLRKSLTKQIYGEWLKKNYGLTPR